MGTLRTSLGQQLQNAGSEPTSSGESSMTNRYLPKGLLLLGLLAVLAAYSAAWSGTLHYDDEINLGGLKGIDGAWSAVEFIFSGASGPTGRPIALATFAMQHAFVA